ncbi:ABC transporter permease [Clostridium swellfunianum]|uniref:FtsX-like permease family protein n=1 Tax=Clostridium swellfunianum TaxID=1367462 RepID=UPI00202ECAE5|nr:FtsX-like permease family protein [Clostridium swellfunianum]MCM0649633.1 ABC transporter permease [Clostridium swellfunianum]
MKRSFFKNLNRDIKKSLSRFLSIVVIITVGVAFYAGVRATSPSMKISADTYFSKNNFMDYKLISTLGLTNGDVEEIKKLSGVTQAEGSYSIDVVVEIDKRQLVLNINSMPAENSINQIKLMKGRKAEAADEVVVEERFMENHKLSLGDTIVLKSGDENALEDNLKSTEFKIVGTAESPLYISEQRQPSSVGNGSVKGFMFILPEVFKSEVYTEIYVKTDSPQSEKSLLDNEGYTSFNETIEKSLKDIGVSRNEIRYAEVLGKANDKLNEAQAELDSSKKEALEKFADGYKELDKAKDKIRKGKEELVKNEVLFNKQMTAAQKQIEDGKKQIIYAESNINAKKKEIADAKLLLGEENPQLKAAEAEINKGAAELEANKGKISASEVELAKGRNEGLAKLSSARKKLEDGQKEIDANYTKLKSEEAKANEKIRDGEVEIQQNRDKLKDIKKPDWYVLGRSHNAGYETYRQDSDRIDSIGKVFPLIFFLVASLVSLTTMTRMVQEKRTEIGTFKALGYSSASIVAHYLIYGLSASILGSIIGIFVGFRLFPSLIMNAYATRYDIGEMIVPFNSNLALQAALIAVLFTAAAAVASALEELREVPASLMRPKPPKSGKTILLERINFIWKRMNFTKKVTARNIFRYKQRLFMTVVGIAACTGLMITGFGLKEGIIGATEAQFSSIYKYDMQGTLSKNLNTSDKNALKGKAAGTLNVKAIMFSYSKNVSINMKDNKSQDAYLVVPENKQELNNYINLSVNSEGLKLKDDGVILTKKLAKLLDKKVGDTIEVNLEDNTFQAKISGITEHYLQHYIYISPDYYESLTGNSLAFNSFYGLLNNLSEEEEDNTLSALKALDDINSVEFKSNVHINFNKMSSAINSVIPVLIVSAGVLAFVVMYNLTNINIEERKRELATIKLLGFFNYELAAYIYRENMILTVLGSLFGVPMGMFFNKFIIGTAETNDILFLQKIGPVYYLISILLTLLFSVVVNLAMYARFDKIDMIESLKSAE